MTTQKSLEQKIDALTVQVAALSEGQRQRAELFNELTPILKDAMRVGSERLGALEEKGYFAFGRGLLEVIDRIVTGYTPEDVEQLAQAVVGILDTVRAMTQPHILELATEASEAASQVDRMAPVGVVGMVRASRDDDVQRGMAVMLQVLRKLGQSAEKSSRRERLQAQLASRRRPMDAAKPAPRRAPAPERPEPGQPKAAPVAAQPPQTVTLDGVEFTQEGFLADPDAWTRELAENLAASIQVEMTDAHWRLIEFARADFKETGASPNIRRLTKGSGLSTKDLYTMFPKAPGKCTALIAGLPKPVGCI